MIEQIRSQSYRDLSELKSPHNLKPVGKTGSVFKQALAKEIYTPDKSESPDTIEHQSRERVSHVASRSLQNTYHHMMPMIQEVRQIAENNGFIGVTADDVIRAYKTGQSFLADYKV